MAISNFVAKEGFNSEYYLSDERNVGKFEFELSYVGCVLGLGENNHYDDSDFYARVWDEDTKSVIKVYYATTRAWTIFNTAEIDATDEVRKKAAAYELKLERIAKAKVLANISNKDRLIATKHKLSIRKIRSLRESIAQWQYDLVFELLSKNIRSGFKKSLRERLINWVNEPNNAYKSPFSNKQWDALLNASQPYRHYY